MTPKQIKTKVKRIARILAELEREISIDTEFMGITFSEPWERGGATIATITWFAGGPELAFTDTPDQSEEDDADE